MRGQRWPRRLNTQLKNENHDVKKTKMKNTNSTSGRFPQNRWNRNFVQIMFRKSFYMRVFDLHQLSPTIDARRFSSRQRPIFACVSSRSGLYIFAIIRNNSKCFAKTHNNSQYFVIIRHYILPYMLPYILPYILPYNLHYISPYI